MASYSCEIIRDNDAPFCFQLELPDGASVWEEAVLSMSDLLKDAGARLEPGETIKVVIRDAEAKLSRSITVLAETWN